MTTRGFAIFIEILLRYIFLESTGGFIGNCHLDASAEEGGKITFPEILDIFKSAIGRYLCSRSRFITEFYNLFLNRLT